LDFGVPDFNGGGMNPAQLDVDSDLDGGYDAVGVESDIGDNLEIMDCGTNNQGQSWGHTRAMPPKKYFKEDDEDFDGFYEDERAEKRQKNRFSKQPTEGVQQYHRGNHGSHQSAGAG
jgi:hypothetical protein